MCAPRDRNRKAEPEIPGQLCSSRPGNREDLADGGSAGGKVGADLSGDEAKAKAHARRVGLVLISAMRARLGSLDRVECIVKVLGMVNSLPNFTDHPRVINGCSDLFHEVFGARGIHARSSVGVESLPGGITVEIEAIVAVKPGD